MQLRILSLLILILTGYALAEPVGRVESLHGGKKLFRQESASAPYYLSHIEQDAVIGNHFKTDGKSMASIRFFLGGNVGMGQGCEIEVVNNRDAKVIKQGNYWMKFDKQNKDSNPIRIQTAGGVMGIRGTEFVLKVRGEGEEQTTELSLLEGTVDVETREGKIFQAVAKDDEAMRVSFGGGQRLTYRLYNLEQLLGNIKDELGPEFFELRETLRESRRAILESEQALVQAESQLQQLLWRLNYLRAAGIINQDVDVGARLAETRENVRRLRAEQAKLRTKEEAQMGENSDTPGITLDELAAVLNGETPSQASERQTVPDSSTVEWPGTPNQKYAILILDRNDIETVHWMAETVGTSYKFPSEAKPLEPGTYVFRVIPIDPDGQLQQPTDYEIQVSG